MSKRLAPFSLALSYPPDPTASPPPPHPLSNLIVRPLRSKMDLATNPVLKAFLAGSFSGTCSTILFQPLDLIKTRQQNISKSGNRRGMFAVAGHVLRTERLLGLWRGLLPSIAKTVPGIGVYFGSLHWLRNRTLNNASEPSPLQAVCLGVAARSFAGSVVIPITVIKTRFEAGTYNYQRMSQALAQIYAREGVRGLCCGLVPTLLRDAPFSGLYLMFYTQLKQKANGNSNISNGATTNFACGILAGFLASLVTHPADVVKTKMQLRPMEYTCIRVAVLRVFAEHGIRGFVSGLAPRMLRRTLMSALAWTVYEQMMREIGLK